MKRRILLGPRIYPNPYCNLLAHELARWGRLGPIGRWHFFHRYDVFVGNWIEDYLGSKRGIRLFLAFLLTFGALAVQKLTTKRVVLVLHNKYPHGAKVSPAFDFLRRQIFRLADTVVVHSRAGVRFAREKLLKKALFHGHPNYAQTFPAAADRRPSDGTVTVGFFGQIRPYKGLEELIRSFLEVEGADRRLVVAGKCADPRYALRLRSLSSSDGRISLDFRFLSDQELFDFLCRVDAVVLPYQGESLLTSGAAALCATVGVPFIARAEDSFEDYRGLEGVSLIERTRNLSEVMRDAAPRKGHLRPLRRHAEAVSWQSFGSLLFGEIGKAKRKFR